MARLEDSHFLDPAGQHAPSPFPLDWHVKGQDEFRDVGDVRPRAGGIRRPSPELDRGFQKAPGLPARFSGSMIGNLAIVESPCLP